MKKIMILAAAICSATISMASAPKNDSFISGSRFSSIEVDGLSKIEYVQASNCYVEVVGSENDKAHTNIKVSGDVLYISQPTGNYTFDGDVKILVASPKLVSLVNKGASDFVAVNAVKADKININNEGKGDVNFAELKARNVKVKNTGSGDSHLKLTCSNLQLDNLGNGSVEANVDCTDVTIRNSESGKVVVSGSTATLNQADNNNSKVDISNLMH